MGIVELAEFDDLSDLNNSERLKLARTFLLKCTQNGDFNIDYLKGLDSGNSFETLKYIFSNGSSDFERSAALYFCYLKSFEEKDYVSGLPEILDFMEDKCIRYKVRRIDLP